MRSFAGAGVGCAPVHAVSGTGAWITTTSGTRLVDFIHGWGSIIAGHAHPAVTTAIATQAQLGTGFGLTNELEVRLAVALAQRTGLPMSRAVNSGTEATMTAIRLARGHTGRELLLKFAGCYHGHSDALLVAAGSGGLTFGNPSSAGVPVATATTTLVLPYNDTEALRDCLQQHGNQLAAVILEPIAGNMNLVVPTQEFIDEIAAGCMHHGAVLISDEVMTGLRATPGLTIRDRFGVEPDLACLGKVIGGGLPVAAVVGSSEIMNKLAPVGPVYQAGTLAGNPVCLAAGLATLELLDAAAYSQLEHSAATLCATLTETAAAAEVTLCAQHVGGMAGYYFCAELPTTLAAVEQTDVTAFEQFHQAMLAAGVLLPPSRFEACFVGLAHDAEALAHSRAGMEQAFAQLAAPSGR